jgi:hypothetical protein
MSNRSDVQKTGPARRPWSDPRVQQLPRLTDLTLASGGAIPGNGDIDGGGSTVIP